MITDFSNAKELPNIYGGSDDKKRIVYNNKIYMLKAASKIEGVDLGDIQDVYSNMPFSEHISCKIAKSAGLPAQDTIIGIFNSRPVVACRDFTYDYPEAESIKVIPFGQLVMSYFDADQTTRTPSLDVINEVLRKHPALSNLHEAAEQRYWDAFVLDALIGNFDRHDGNWGYLENEKTKTIFDLAPVYDCGSSLYPKRSDSGWELWLADEKDRTEKLLLYPTAALRLAKNDKTRVRYGDFLLSPEGVNARKSLLQLYPKIDFTKINKIIDDTPLISSIRKKGYKVILKQRYDMFLTPAYEKALEENKNATIKHTSLKSKNKIR